MVIIYTSPGCGSCRKAKRWLQDNHITYLEKNIFSNLLQENEVKYLLSRCENGTTDIISTRSKAYHTLKKNIDEFSIQELIAIIQKNPSILKRPIIVSEHTLVVGYDDDEITALLPHPQRHIHQEIQEDPSTMNQDSSYEFFIPTVSINRKSSSKW